MTPVSFLKQPLPFLGRDPTKAEVKEWDRLERLREYAADKSRAFSSRDLQEVTVHHHALYSSPCWLCGQPMSLYNAFKAVFLPRFDSLQEHRCLRCRAPMLHLVPVVCWDSPWTWARPENFGPQDIIDTLEASRSLWSAP